MVYLLIAWVDFPWRTVSHNQRVITNKNPPLFLRDFNLPPTDRFKGSLGRHQSAHKKLQRYPSGNKWLNFERIFRHERGGYQPTSIYKAIQEVIYKMILIRLHLDVQTRLFSATSIAAIASHRRRCCAQGQGYPPRLWRWCANTASPVGRWHDGHRIVGSDVARFAKDHNSKVTNVLGSTFNSSN